jgi:hypothetical protein
MLTGDATPVARETGTQVGLDGSRIIDVAHLRAQTRRAVVAEGKYKTNDELEKVVDERLWALPQLNVDQADGFGEIFPQVLRLVLPSLSQWHNNN